MRARVVIGANFGDEGKGLVVDYLCAKEGAGSVVRFNGGAQAGHTVVTPDGARHVFSHFGAGTFCNVPTFLSQFFVCNPLKFLQEAAEFASSFSFVPSVFAHPNCLVTTFADMIINQRKEDQRAAGRHGSVGLGVHETIARSKGAPHLKITMSDLWNNTPIEDRLKEICGQYAAFRTGKEIEQPDGMIAAFIEWCGRFADMVHPAGIGQCKDPVFEGAQGLLLDQDNKEFFPHVTHSKTGMHNVRLLCAQAGITDIDIYYVSRTYLTRHGAGPLPGEDLKLSYPDDTNGEHPYQGKLRFAPLKLGPLVSRCMRDAGGDAKLVFTHCDQGPAPLGAALYANGPTRNHVSTNREG